VTASSPTREIPLPVLPTPPHPTLPMAAGRNLIAAGSILALIPRPVLAFGRAR